MLKAKSDVSSVLPIFYKLIPTQLCKESKSIWSDNASELNLTDFFRAKGVIHLHSCVERPQQNSAVERKRQHILNVARALLFQSN